MKSVPIESLVAVLCLSLLTSPLPARAAEVFVPLNWAGQWRIVTSYTDTASGSVVAVERITNDLCPQDPLGLALLEDQEPTDAAWVQARASRASCIATATDVQIAVHCDGHVTLGVCDIQGLLQIGIERSGETLLGSGEWSVTASGVCGRLVSVGETIRISGTRLGPVEGACAQPSSNLAEKFAKHPWVPILEPPLVAVQANAFFLGMLLSACAWWMVRRRRRLFNRPRW